MLSQHNHVFDWNENTVKIIIVLFLAWSLNFSSQFVTAELSSTLILVWRDLLYLRADYMFAIKTKLWTVKSFTNTIYKKTENAARRVWCL